MRLLILGIFGMIHEGTWLMKIQSLFIFSIVASPFTWLIDRFDTWHIGNEQYVEFVIGAIVIDHFLGTLYHAFWKRDFSLWENLKGFLIKCVIVVTMMYLFEGLNTLMAQESILKNYTIMILRLMVFLYPAGSAFGNSYEMTGKKFPPVGFMNKLKQFSESATINTNERN